MANLKNTTIENSVEIQTSQIKKKSANSTALDLNDMPLDAIYIRKFVTQHDPASRSTGTSWTLAYTFPTITDFQKNSKILFFYSIPLRNNSTSWGGCYLEPQVQFDGGSWQSMGSSGYDAVMYLGCSSIRTYRNKILLEPNINSNFSARFRIYYRSYDGTIEWSSDGRDNGEVSGTAPLLNSSVNNFFYATIQVKELAKINGG
jgi:hypothetical protein